MKPTPHQQRDLFDSPAQLVAALGRATKYALRAAVEASGLSRAEVAHRANELAAEAGVAMCAGNGALSEATLGKWLDPKATGHMPGLVGLTVLCMVLDDAGIFAAALGVLGHEIMGPEDQKYRDLGRATHELKQARQALKRAEENL